MKQLFLLLTITCFTVTGIAQNVGIGTTSPTYLLDVNGRMRIRHNGSTAGLWFNGSDNKEAAFTGMVNDSVVGFYGYNNWKMGVDLKNERVGIGNMVPTSPLSFATTLGKKISLYRGTTGDAGFGVFGNELRINSDYNGADITFGYDNLTSGFKENMRVTGSGNVGIGVYPTAKLDVYTSAGDVGLKHSWAGGSLVSVAPTLLTPATIRSNSAAVQLTTNTNIGLYIKLDGNTGIGVNNPGRQLDVNGRMRIRGTVNDVNNSAGIYLDGPNTIERAFIGMQTNDKVGIYGSGYGWGMSMDANNANINMYGNVSIGSNAVANSKLQVSGGVSLPFKRLNDENYTVTDNDYTIYIAISAARGISRTITLPGAANRGGRMYIISAAIPISNSGTDYSTVTIIDGSTGANIIGQSLSLTQSGLLGSNYQGSPFLYNHYDYYAGAGNANDIFSYKQTSITLQSDGANWKIVSNDFSNYFIYDFYD